MRSHYLALPLLALLILPGCREEAVVLPEPVALTENALSHYCQMWIADHGGPKAQIHLEGFPEPIFFAQVRDALAYLRSPERDAPVIAVYVSDMAQAPSWEKPGPSNWANASKVVFVVGADVQGGMGAPEVVPFGSEGAARNFASDHGGKIMRLEEIPGDAVLSAVDFELPGETVQ